MFKLKLSVHRFSFYVFGLFLILPFLAFPMDGGHTGGGGNSTISFPTGDLASDYEPSYLGFGGKLMLGIKPFLSVDIGFGYNLKYPRKWDYAFGPEPEDINDYYLSTIAITFGASCPINFGNIGVYFGGGGAFVSENFNVGESWTGDDPEDKNKPGFYVAGGFKYGFTYKLVLDLNPRWLMVLDAEDDDVATPIDESTSNSKFVDFLIGLDYYFL